jgi:beta-lactamase superfamily II metal-dependent hydrolase
MKRLRKRATTWLSALVVLAGGAWGYFSADGPGAQIVFLDIGQGDATFIRSPEGRTALIDGGRGQRRLLDLLEELGLEAGMDTIDLMIASHADFDHIGGLVGAAEEFPPRNFMDNTVVHDTLAYENLLVAIDEAGSRLLEPTRRTIDLGSLRLEILPPPLTTRDQNTNSIGVVVHHGSFTVLIAGDATHSTQTYWRATYPNALTSIEVYRSAHHGSDTGDSLEFLQFIDPEVVVVSVGEGNPYGHPEPEAMASYNAITDQVFRTDEVSHVAVGSAGNGQFGYDLATGQLEITPTVDVVAVVENVLSAFR